MKICAKVEIPRDILVEISQELQRISNRYKVRTETYLNWTFKCQMHIKDYDYNRVVNTFEHFAKLVNDKNISIGGILSFGCEDIKIPEKPIPDISNIAIKLNPSNDIFLLRKRIMETLHDDDYFKNIFLKKIIPMKSLMLISSDLSRHFQIGKSKLLEITYMIAIYSILKGILK